LRKPNPLTLPATNQPDGQITKILSISSRQNISLNPPGKSVILICASRPIRGALRTSRTLRWDAVDARRGERRACELADGEVVWSWRPDAWRQACGNFLFEKFLEVTVAKKPVTGESTK
jgi:hypothetical protein